MSFWELVGLPSKTRIEEQSRMILDLSEAIKEIKTQQNSIISRITKNEESISESILLNSEAVKETETKMNSLLNDSRNKNHVLKGVLSILEDTNSQVKRINQSNLAESIQNLNNMNTKSFMQMHNIINELNIYISNLGQDSIMPMFKNLSVIEETLRLILVNDLIDDAEDVMKYLEDKK